MIVSLFPTVTFAASEAEIQEREDSLKRRAATFQELRTMVPSVGLVHSSEAGPGFSIDTHLGNLLSGGEIDVSMGQSFSGKPLGEGYVLMTVGDGTIGSHKAFLAPAFSFSHKGMANTGHTNLGVGPRIYLDDGSHFTTLSAMMTVGDHDDRVNDRRRASLVPGAEVRLARELGPILLSAEGCVSPIQNLENRNKSLPEFTQEGLGVYSCLKGAIKFAPRKTTGFIPSIELSAEAINQRYTGRTVDPGHKPLATPVDTTEGIVKVTAGGTF